MRDAIENSPRDATPHAPRARAADTGNTAAQAGRPEPLRQVPVPLEVLRALVEDSPRLAGFGLLAIGAAETAATCERVRRTIAQAPADALQTFEFWDTLARLLPRNPLGDLLDLHFTQDMLDADVRTRIQEIDAELEELAGAVADARDAGADMMRSLPHELGKLSTRVEWVSGRSGKLFRLSVKRLEECATAARYALEGPGDPSAAPTAGTRVTPYAPAEEEPALRTTPGVHAPPGHAEGGDVRGATRPGVLRTY